MILSVEGNCSSFSTQGGSRLSQFTTIEGLLIAFKSIALVISKTNARGAIVKTKGTTLKAVPSNSEITEFTLAHSINKSLVCCTRSTGIVHLLHIQRALTDIIIDIQQ